MPVCLCCLNGLDGAAEDNYPPQEVSIPETPPPPPIRPRAAETATGSSQSVQILATNLPPISPARNPAPVLQVNAPVLPGPSTRSSATENGVIPTRRDIFFKEVETKLKGTNHFVKSRSLTDLSCLPCGHLFHTRCLQEWFVSPSGKKSCPHCLKAVAISKIIKAFVSEEDGQSSQAATIARTRAKSLQTNSNREVVENAKRQKLEKEVKDLKSEVATLKENLEINQVVVDSLNMELEIVQRENRNLRAENKLYTEGSDNRSTPSKRSHREI